MANCVGYDVTEDSICVTLDVENEDVMAIGAHMNEICDQAYMNGYNWDAFLTCYLEVNAPEIADAIDTDPEAGMYCAYFNGTDDATKALAKSFKQLIEKLLDNEEEIYDFLRENADDIEWD